MARVTPTSAAAAQLATFAVAGLLAAVFTVGCGEDPYCGDGNVDSGEECDDGNNNEDDVCLSTCVVRPVPALTVKWVFNENTELGYTGDNCTDMQARDVEVSIDGPVSASGSDSCPTKQVRFADLTSGTYSIGIDVLDSNGQSLTTSTVTTEYDFVACTLANRDECNDEVIVNVPFDAWSQSDFTGSFFFRTAWAGQDCAAASVSEQVLTLERDGASIASVTKLGHSLQGDASECQSNAAEEPQTVLEVPSGPATMTIQGLDSGAQVTYEQVFDIFIGVGLLNPEVLFDVAAAE